jgi:hypothetical protein
MTRGQLSVRTSAWRTVTVFALLAGAACESQPAPPSSPSPSESSPPSESPSSSLQVQMIKIGSRDELLQRLTELGWTEVVILPNGDPKSVEIWGGDDHWHAQTHYLFGGRRIAVTQTDIGGLPPGRLVRVRGEDGIRSQGILYWIEREFVVALSPGDKRLAAKLEWIPSGS